MTNNPYITNPYIIGVIAAVVFSAMMVIFSAMGFFVLIPVFLGALPIYIAALGWGTRAGIVATVAIVAFAAIMSDPASGLLIGMMIAAPAAVAGHQANLAQQFNNGDGQLQWYPFSSHPVLDNIIDRCRCSGFRFDGGF